MTEARRALLSYTRREIAKALASALLLCGAGPAARAAIGLGVVPTVSAPASRTLATFTLVNNGGGTMAAGTTSPMFGFYAKQGDIPSGTAPIVSASSVTQPYSWGLQVYYPDGSLQFASLFFRSTFSLAASGTQAIVVKNGGTAPSASARSLATDIYSQSIAATIVAANNSGTPIAPANFSGTLGAWLDSAANTNNNNWQQSLIHDGAAGRTWKVRCHMSPTKTGSPDGQTDCDFYVMATTDAGGTLGGIRLLPIIQRPWYNSTSGSANLIPIQPNCSFQYGAGPTTVDMVTAGTFPFTNHVFTVSSGQASTTTANNYYIGSDAAGFIPCYVTNSGGALPTGLSANTLYYVLATNGNNNVTFYTAVPNGYYGGAATISGGSGTNTIVPVGAINQYCPYAMATTGGRWNEFTGTGSGNTGTSASLQMQMDKTYFVSAGLIPFDLTISGSVTDNTWAFSYTPYTSGPWKWNGATGPAPELGILPTEHVIHFHTQSALSDKLVRVSGYAGNNQFLHWRDAPVAMGGGGTGQIPNFNNAAYTGMPAFIASPIQVWDPGRKSGFNVETNYFAQQDTTWDHKPCSSAWPYILTGEPQYLDILINMGAGSVAQAPGSADTSRNPITPAALATFGVVAGFNLQQRTTAWSARDLFWAAIFTPTTFYDGSALGQNLRDIAANNTAWINGNLNPTYDCFGNACKFSATINGTTLTMVGAPTSGLLLTGQVITSGAAANTTIVKQLTGTAGGSNGATYQVSPSQNVGSSTAMVSSSTSYVTTYGMWSGVNPDYGATIFIPGYQLFYYLMAICLGAGGLKDANAKSFLQAMSTRYNHILNTIGGWCMYDYDGAPSALGTYPTGAYVGWPPISDDSQLGVAPNVGPPGPASGANWSSAGYGGSPTNYFQWTGTGQAGSGFVPANNDKWIWLGGLPIPSVGQLYTPYYAGDVQGNNFNLYTAPSGGGTKLVPVDSGSFSGIKASFLAPANPPASSTGDQPTYGPTDAEGMVAFGDGAFSWMTALGITGMGPVTTDSRTRRNDSSGYTNVDALPVVAFQTSF